MPALTSKSRLSFGYVAVHMTPLLLILIAAISRAGKALIWWTVATAVVAFVQPIWVTSFRGEILASVHVLGALVLLAFSFQVARLATVSMLAEAATWAFLTPCDDSGPQAGTVTIRLTLVRMAGVKQPIDDGRSKPVI